MSKITVALIGAGQRGKDVYANYALEHPENIEFVSVVEPNEIKRNEVKEKHKMDDDLVFDNWDDFFAKGKICDAVVIATPDDQHYIPTKKALELDYDVLLEKPMANNPEETIKLGEIAKERNNVFMICHVLRYTPFYSKLKELVDENVIGEIVNIQHIENVGYYHFGHSFVRGNWRNSDLSSPIILQKSCHDLDVLLWLVNSDCKKVASFGKLTHFTEENKPEGAGSRCVDCAVEETCIYSAKDLYLNNVGKWPTTAITPVQTYESVEEAIKTGPYGKCVYETDNNVADHQSTILEFENGVTVDFTLSAFSNEVFREIKIMGTEGVIRGSDLKNEISVRRFGEDKETIIRPVVVAGGHGGGDTGIMQDFISLVKGEKTEALTGAEISVQSHMMAFAAEKARVENKIIDMEEYYKEF